MTSQLLSVQSEELKFQCYFLNPRFHYQEGFEFSDNIRSGVTKVIERLAPNVTFAIEATREIAQFRGKIGRFGDLTAQTAVGIMNPVELERQSYCDLKVTNSTEHHVAFKVKTTSPRKYFVRPNTGIILPMDSCIITVTMQAPREYPPDMQCKDKFLLLSTIVSPSAESDGIPQDAFNKDGEKTIEECKLRVVYTLPPGHGNSGDNPFFTPSNSMLRSSRLHSDTNSMHSSSSFEDIQALTRLKEERDAAIQQQQQLKQELEMLKRRRSHRSNEGFSVMFAGLVGVVGVLVGLIINVALSPSK